MTVNHGPDRQRETTIANYRYQARDNRGESVSGVVSAASLDEAGQLLRAEGKFITNLTAISDSDAAADAAPRRATGRIKRTDVIFFLQGLSVMLETGVSMSDALDCLVDQCENEAFKAVLHQITQRVQAGGEFSKALAQHPKVFPNLVIALIQASEVSGTMSSMLDRIGAYLSKEQQILRQARGALMYPLFMMLTAVTVTIFLLAFVLPRFAKIYANKEAALPAPTQLLMTTSEILVNYWYFWLGGTIAAAIALVVTARTPSGRRALDWIKINAPVCRNLYSKLYITRACRTMGTMITAGVSILDMIQIVKNVTTNTYYSDLWDATEEQLTRGAQLTDPMFESPLFPRAITQMIYSGEKAGRLGQVMNKIADFTEVEFEQAVKSTTQFIEPVMIAVMGAVIGFIAISLLLPIFSVGRVMAE